MAPDATAPAIPVQYSYNFSEKANEMLFNTKLTPQSIFKAVHISLSKLSSGPTPSHNNEIEPLIPGNNELFSYKIDDQYVLHFQVIEAEKKFVVFWVGRFN